MRLLNAVRSGQDLLRRAISAPFRGRIDPIALNLKFQGYDMARRLVAERGVPEPAEPRHVGLTSKPATQMDLDSDWATTWLAALKIPLIYHRKIWEYVYLLQALHEAGMLQEGRRGLGFGCGREPVASYLASQGVDLLVTDLPLEDMARAGWARTDQHAGDQDEAFHEHLVSYEVFDARVSHRPVDMNAIPEDLRNYDFCWSLCAFEHLGSIDKGLAFVENAMASLRPGGVAVHTTEFNYLDDRSTIEHGDTVLFQKRHFEALAERLIRAGHVVAPLDFFVGDQPLDRFIDVPPYPNDYTEAMRRQWGTESSHLKLMVSEYACTCFGVIVFAAQ